MSTAESVPFDPTLFSRLVDGLYVEAMVMADDARSYFDGPGMDDRAALDVMGRLSFACESLKVTTRLMHSIAWLLIQKAWRRGDISDAEINSPKYLLGDATTSDAGTLHAMPVRARELAQGSQSLYDRVRRMQVQYRSGPEPSLVSVRQEKPPFVGPARELLIRLQQSI